MTDESFEEAVRTIMQDDNVDLGIVGRVPMTAALNIVPGGPYDGCLRRPCNSKTPP